MRQKFSREIVILPSHYGEQQQQAACTPSYLCADLQRKRKKEKQQTNMEERMFKETRAARIVRSAESVGGKQITIIKAVAACLHLF